MVAEVVGVGVDEWLRIALIPLREVVVGLREELRCLVGQVEEPESNREECELDEIGNEVVVSGKQVLGKVIRPVNHVLRLQGLNERFDSGEASERQQQRVEEHEEEVSVEDGDLP